MGGTCYTIWRAAGAVRLARRLYFQLWKLERGRLCCVVVADVPRGMPCPGCRCADVGLCAFSLFFGHAWCVCHIIIILLILIVIIININLSSNHMEIKVPPKNHCSMYLRKTLRYLSMCSIFEHFLEEATFEGVGHKLIFCDFSVSVRVNCFPVRIWTCYKSRGCKKGANDMTFSITRKNSWGQKPISQVLKPDVCYASCDQIFVLLDLSHSEKVDHNVPWRKVGNWPGIFFDW